MVLVYHMNTNNSSFCFYLNICFTKVFVLPKWKSAIFVKFNMTFVEHLLDTMKSAFYFESYKDEQVMVPVLRNSQANSVDTFYRYTL